MCIKVKIIVLTVIVLPAIFGMMPGHGKAKEKTGQLSISAEVLDVCDVVTLSRAHDAGTFEERLRFWRISIMCSIGLNFSVSLRSLDGFDGLGDETTISTDLSLSSFGGTGTGDWEPLIQYSDILNASGGDSETIQLTLIY